MAAGVSPEQTERLEEIRELLVPPAGWRDPVTGLPAGWTDDEDDDWAEFEQAMRR